VVWSICGKLGRLTFAVLDVIKKGDQGLQPWSPTLTRRSALMNTEITTIENLQVKPCRKCGAQNRYKSGACRPCRLVTAKRWRQENPDKRAEYHKRYAEKYPEKIAAKSKRWDSANPARRKNNEASWRKSNVDRCKANRAKWKECNRDRLKIYSHNRRAKSSGGRLSIDIVDRLMHKQGGRCVYCKVELDTRHIDHIMPIALGGTNTDDNVQLLCPPCNLSKGAKHPLDFAKERGIIE